VPGHDDVRHQVGVGSSAGLCKDMVDRYLDLGGNFIDTANKYTEGAETIVADVLGERRDRAVLATNYSLSMREGDPNYCGNHRKNLVQSVEASLRRLKTDHIDLLYLHAWDSLTPIGEVWPIQRPQSEPFDSRESAS
jgi:aryl-alcohol dehydrogenase-like predicted oxidoreductase